MARPIPMLGPIEVTPDGGGTFNPMVDQPMPPRTGDLCVFAAEEPQPCQEGPRDEGPAPGTATGEAGLLDGELADRWLQIGPSPAI